MWRGHIPKFKIAFPFEVLVSSEYRTFRNLAFCNVLARQVSSFCNRERLNFQVTKMAAREGCRVGQKLSDRFGFFAN